LRRTLKIELKKDELLKINGTLTANPESKPDENLGGDILFFTYKREFSFHQPEDPKHTEDSPAKSRNRRDSSGVDCVKKYVTPTTLQTHPPTYGICGGESTS